MLREDGRLRLRLPQAVGLFHSTRPMSSGVAGTLSFCAVALRSGFSGSGFVLNDILDFHKDRAAGVCRPIAEELVSRRLAGVFAVLLLAAALWIASLLGRGAGILIFAAAALVLYTPVARAIPPLKGFYVAMLCLAPLWYGVTIARGQVQAAAYAVDGIFIFGRELLMDAHELSGDRLAGMHTLAAVLGADPGRRLGVVLMVASLASLNLVARGAMGRAAAAVSVSSLLLVVAWPRMPESRRIALSRAPMLAAAMALASG